MATNRVFQTEQDALVERSSNEFVRQMVRVILRRGAVVMANGARDAGKAVLFKGFDVVGNQRLGRSDPRPLLPSMGLWPAEIWLRKPSPTTKKETQGNWRKSRDVRCPLSIGIT